jgi:uncharacterized membrane protein
MSAGRATWFWNHARFFGAVALGIVLFLVLPQAWQGLPRALLAWDVAALGFMALLYAHHSGLNAQQLRERYQADDPSASIILLLIVCAAIVSLAGIVAFLPTLKSVPHATRVAHGLLATLTIFVSWLLVPTIFTVHYADMFYSADERQQPLIFPRTTGPVFWDFVYFSMTIAVACQTADVTTADSSIRRVVVVHSVISFLFNVAILGFAINVTAGLLA